MARHSLLLLMVVSVAWTLAALTHAQDLRLETDVFVGNQKEPMAQNLTIFTSGLIYDFPLTGPEEITVFDPQRGRFVLLDVPRRVKTTITTQELVQFTAAMKVHAKELDGVFGFAANPDFSVSFDSDEAQLTLDSKVLSYRVQGAQPKLSEAVKMYRNFADWYARLNSTRPGNLPPFARMEVNRELADRGLIPQEVELMVAPKNRLLNRTLTIRSRHLANWSLSNTDRERVEKAGAYMAEFDAVSFQDYQKTLKVAATE